MTLTKKKCYKIKTRTEKELEKLKILRNKKNKEET